MSAARCGHADRGHESAVAGEITFFTSSTTFAGNPDISACFLIASCTEKTCKTFSLMYCRINIVHVSLCTGRWRTTLHHTGRFVDAIGPVRYNVAV